MVCLRVYHFKYLPVQRLTVLINTLDFAGILQVPRHS